MHLFYLFSQHGFSNNLETYGLISGLWTSTFALGAFIGPSIAGILYDIVGFGYATLFVIVLSAIVVSKRKRKTFHKDFTYYIDYSNYKGLINSIIQDFESKVSYLIIK